MTCDNTIASIQSSFRAVYRRLSIVGFLMAASLTVACDTKSELPAVSVTNSSADSRILSMPTTMSDGSPLAAHTTLTVETSIPLISRGLIGGIAVDTDGKLYNANNSQSVWKTGPQGETVLLTAGLKNASGNMALPDGSLLQSDWGADVVYRISSDGTKQVFSETGLNGPVGIAHHPDGYYLVVNHKGGYVSKIPDAGGDAELVLVDERLAAPNGITVDGGGTVYISGLKSADVFKWVPGDKLEVLASLPGRANGHLVVAFEALYVNKLWDHAIFRVDLDTGNYGLVSGNGRPGYEDGLLGEATIEEPNGITFDADRQTIFFNTHRGIMGDGPGLIVIRSLQIER